MYRFVTVFSALLFLVSLSGCGAFIGQSELNTYNSLKKASETALGANQSGGVGYDPFDGTDDLDRPLPVPTDDVDLGVNQIKSCQAGEIDIIRLAMHCNQNQNLILTRKDKSGEKVIENFGSTSEKGIESIIAELKGLRAADKVQGGKFDLFLCLDSSSDGKCTDEQVMDLNALNKPILLSSRYFYKINKDDKEDKNRRELNKLCEDPDLATLSQGLVLSHAQYEDSSQEFSKSQVVQRMTAEKMAEFVKNISLPGEVQTYTSGTRVELSLVESDMDSCRDIGKRIHGCFTVGTQIQISKTLSLPIEDLRPGDSVQLSDGRSALISRMVKGPEKEPIVSLQMTTGEKIRMTANHPVWTEEGIKQASDLKLGNSLYVQDKGWTPVQALAQESYEGLVYNLELEGDKTADHLILSNRIVTGDLHLQNKLDQDSAPTTYLTQILTTF